DDRLASWRGETRGEPLSPAARAYEERANGEQTQNLDQRHGTQRPRRRCDLAVKHRARRDVLQTPGLSTWQRHDQTADGYSTRNGQDEGRGTHRDRASRASDGREQQRRQWK